jgi:zinc transport system substrate-binding protein
MMDIGPRARALHAPGALAVAMLAGMLLISRPGFADDADPLEVRAANYPLAYFAERIAGVHARVVLPAPPGIDPASWRPDAAAVLEFQQADLILLNGAGYAKWVATATLPQQRTVDTSRAFRDRYIESEHRVRHSHGPGGAHDHGGIAFTTWLDFTLAAAQARAIADALVAARPALTRDFERGFESLTADLGDLDRRMSAAARAAAGHPLLASHPVYQYLARRYRLDLRALTWEPDAMPAEEEWSRLAKLLETHPARIMIWEAAPLPEVTERLRGSAIGTVVFEPCGNAPRDGDFLSVMNRNIAAMETAFAR